MHAEPSNEVTECVARITAGDTSAVPELLPLVYDELRRIAGGMLGAERPAHTLQATALVNEAYLKLVGQTGAEWKSRAHFAAVAADAMRRILIDHARGRNTAKRGGGAGRVTLAGLEDSDFAVNLDVLDLDAALCTLRELSARQAQVVELRYFGGLTVPEVAEVLGVSERTVKDDWRVARAWLQARLEES